MIDRWKPSCGRGRDPRRSPIRTWQSLARRFGVSYEAAVWRLKSLGHIGSRETNALLAQKDTGNRYMQCAWVSTDPFGNGDDQRKTREQELRGQLVRLAVEAFRQEEISRGRLIEIAKKLFSRPFGAGRVRGSDARGLMGGSSDGACDRRCRHVRSH